MMRSESLNVRLIVFAALAAALFSPMTASAQDDTSPWEIWRATSARTGWITLNRNQARSEP